MRTIDYAVNMGRLFSASDDGKLLLWDLSVEKVASKYSSYDETGNFSGYLPDKSDKKSSRKHH